MFSLSLKCLRQSLPFHVVCPPLIQHVLHPHGLHVLHLELLAQGLNVIIDPLDKLGLILHGVGPDEQGVEPGEDPEHFIGTTLLSDDRAPTSSILISKVDLLDSISISRLQSNGLWLDLQLVGLTDVLGYHRPQLLVLPPKLHHVLHPLLQPLVGEVDPPHHFEVITPLLLDDVHHQTPELVIPGGEHLVALRHHLLKLLVGDVHEAPGAQHLQQLAGHVPGDGLHQPQGSLDRVLRVTIHPEMVENSLDSRPDPVQLSGGQQVVDGEVLQQWGSQWPRPEPASAWCQCRRTRCRETSCHA